MLEIIKKRLVGTRKNHQCFGCEGKIEKGEAAVFATAREDGEYRKLYFHEECNRAIVKNKVLMNEIGVYLGCVSEEQKRANQTCYWCISG